MDGMRVIKSITIASVASGSYVFRLPFGATLIEVNSTGSNAHNSTLAVTAGGTSVIPATAMGVSGANAQFTTANMTGAAGSADGISPPRFAKGTLIAAVLVQGATAATNCNIDFVFLEG